MDYITIQINKKFLFIVGMALLYLGTLFVVHKRAYNRGAMDAFQYYMQQKVAQEQSNGDIPL